MSQDTNDDERLPRILICVALSPHARAVAGVGAAVAARLGARPLFVSVAEDDVERHRRAVNEVIAQIEPRPEVADEQVLIRQGKPATAILRVARETRADLIVMGALDRDPPMVRLWGSVARRVARSAPCSVLLLPIGAPERLALMRQIVASVTMDLDSVGLLNLMLRLVHDDDDPTLHLVHEFPVTEARWLADDTTDETGRRITLDEYLRLRQSAEDAAVREFISGFDTQGLATRAVALPGGEGLAVIDYAVRVDADLLVMPTPAKRLTFWDRFFHHPVEMALRQLPCGLLLYRAAAHRLWGADARDVAGGSA